MSPLWLYALVDRELADPGPGLAGERLQALPVGALVAIAGEVPELPTVTPEALQAHDRVVRRLGEALDPLLPARFGQTARGPDELRRQLEERQQELGRALQRVAGCVQMTLRLFGDPFPDELVSPGERADAAAGDAGLGPGGRYLAHRRRARQLRHRLPEAEELLRAVQPLICAQRLERQVRGALVGTAYHPLPRARLPEYRQRVSAMGPRLLPRTLALTGPAPPYAFAGLPEGP